MIHTIYGRHPNDLLFVSIDGDVRIAKRTPYMRKHKWEAYKATIINSGYASLGHRGLVHRLVHETFMGAIPKGFQVDHIDEDKLNNTVENLQLLTRQKNSAKSTLRGDECPWSTITDKEAQLIWDMSRGYVTYNGRMARGYRKEIQEVFDVSIGTIDGIVRGSIFKGVNRCQA